jgi:hypothetical protein
MTKKKRNEEEVPFGPEETEEGFSISEDFDLAEEYKPSPLIPAGVYHGYVTEVVFDPLEQTIVWTFTLNNNGGVLSDGETPIDGNQLVYRNWLPKPGDGDRLTKKGNMTIRQAKINMLHDFAKSMGIDLSTPAKILEGIANGDWIGLEKDLKVKVREYEGRTFNDIDRVV